MRIVFLFEMLKSDKFDKITKDSGDNLSCKEIIIAF